MKAITYTQYGSADVLQLSEVATPTPGENDVLVKIFATTVTPVDCAFRAGNPFIARLFTGLRKPKNQILGTEFAGEICAIGKSVTKYKVGDKVFAGTPDGFGAHAEYIAMGEDGAMALIPADLTFEEAAAIGNGGLTALPFLRDNGKIKSGDKVLINGASGSIGVFAIQLAKHFGAEVTAVCSGANHSLVKSLGADHVVDYTVEDFTKTGQAYDIIFDTVGKSTFWQSRRVLTVDGIYLSPTTSLPTMLHMLWTSKFARKKAIFAATGLRPDPDKIKDLAFICALFEDGKLQTTIDRSYPLAQIAQAHRFVDKGHKRGNVIITVAHDAA